VLYGQHQQPHPWIDTHVLPQHARVVHGRRIEKAEVASKTGPWVAEFDNGNASSWNGHSRCVSCGVQYTLCGDAQLTLLLLASTSAWNIEAQVDVAVPGTQ
jgi:hypothetical protein